MFESTFSNKKKSKPQATKDSSTSSEYSSADLMEDPELNMELIYSVNDALRNSVCSNSFSNITKIWKKSLYP